MADTLDEKGAPLLNRAFSSYPVGSVFKLVVAAAALEKGVSTSLVYDCPGSISVDGMEFKCFNGVGHGKVDLEKAIAYSCNGYFIKLTEQMKPEELLSMAEKLGFGSSVELAPGMSSSAGNLPVKKDLSNPKAKANFSFGQGDLLATPLQIAAMVNTIASGGLYTEPSLVEGLVDENLVLTEQEQPKQAERVISSQTAGFLQKAMRASIEYGTSKRVSPRQTGRGKNLHGGNWPDRGGAAGGSVLDIRLLSGLQPEIRDHGIRGGRRRRRNLLRPGFPRNCG
ncbi:hypothetical protein DWY99_04675 [[Clostridium] leptum]|uniref:Penicillin-binding protein transpeptidase domain-containing protein n=1 Tax=[Clostridium] leptum TaxID=1535 RepID=A0A412AYW1_9FIRM|nr:hypothetical protein DWY99_04675 [[Clostridium] leptum]